MLVLTRKVNEAIFIGEDVRILLVGIDGKQAKIGISCPDGLHIMRSELGTRTKKGEWPNLTPNEITYLVARYEELKEWWTKPNAKDKKSERNDLESFIQDLEHWALSGYLKRYAEWYQDTGN